MGLIYISVTAIKGKGKIMLSFDEVWMERELENYIPVLPSEEKDAEKVAKENRENRLNSEPTTTYIPTETETTSAYPVNFAVKAKHRKHFHASMEEGRYHNGSRENKPEKTYSLYNKAEARRREKETFKTEIPFRLAEAEQELADVEEEEYYSDADFFSDDDYDWGFEEGKEYILKILRTTGAKLTVEGLGEVSFKDLEKYYAQML
jgi:di/tripeptidase